MSFASDDFTRADGELNGMTASDGVSTWTARDGTGAMSVYSNALYTPSAGRNGYYNSATPANADYSVQADLSGVSTYSSNGVAGRMDTASNSQYWACYNAGIWALYKRVSSTDTQLGTYTGDALSGGAKTILLRMSGSTISVEINGVQRISVTDTSITAKGKAGLFAYFSDPQNSRLLDNWSANDATAAGSTLSSAGSATDNAQGQSLASSAANSTAAATATLAGKSTSTAAMTAGGTATATLVGAQGIAAAFSAAGTAADDNVGASLASVPMTSQGTATMGAEGASSVAGDLAISASATADFVGDARLGSADLLVQAGSTVTWTGTAIRPSSVIHGGSRRRIELQQAEDEELLVMVRDYIAPEIVKRLRKAA